jgi:hypothetical protein
LTLTENLTIEKVQNEMKKVMSQEVIKIETLKALKRLAKFTKSAGSTRLYSKFKQLNEVKIETSLTPGLRLGIKLESPGKSEQEEGPPSPSSAAGLSHRPYPRKVVGVLPPLDPS